MTFSFASIITTLTLFFAAIGASLLLTKLIGRFLPKAEEEDENVLPK